MILKRIKKRLADSIGSWLRFNVSVPPREREIAFNRISDSIVSVDNEWRYTFLNDAALANLSLTTVETLGKVIWDIHPSLKGTILWDMYHAAMQTRKRIELESYYEPMNNWVSIKVYPSDDGLTIFYEHITEKEKTSRELDLKEKRFQELLENNPAIISLTDDSLNSIYRSPSSTNITGWKDEDMKITGGINCVHPDDLNIMKTIVVKAIKNPGIPQPYLSRYLHKEGHYIWLEGTATKLPNDSIVKGIVFNSSDVTEKIELENLLRKANTLARIGSWEVDLLKGTVYWNDITREIHEAETSFVPALATGLNFYKEGPGRDLITQKVKEAIEQGKPWDEELEIVTVKNNVRWIRTIGEPEFVEGKCLKIYGSFQDIDQRRKAEEKIIESEKLYRNLFTNMLHGFAYCKVIYNEGKLIDYIYLIVNSEYEALTGLQDITGKNMSHVMPDLLESDPAYVELMDSVSQHGKSEKFETYVAPLDKWFSVSIYSPAKGYFVTLVDNITERKKSEVALAESENYLRTILNTEPECVKTLNSKGELLSMNPAGLAMIEANNEQQVLGHRMTELVDEKYRIGFNRLSKEVFNGNSGTFEFEVTGLKGGHRWLETHAVPLKDAAGKVINLLGVTRDITERKKAEQFLTQSEEKQKIILQTLLDNVVILNAAGEIRYINHVSQGLTEEEVIGSNWLLWLHEEDQPKAKEAIRQTLDSGAVPEIEIRSIGVARKMTWFNVKMVRMPDLAHAQVLLVATDMTERKKAEEQNTLLASIVNTSDDAILSKTLQGIITSWNYGAEKVFGYAADEIVGKSILSLIPPHLQSEETEIINKIRKGELIRHYETERMRKDGKIINVSLTISPLKDSSGQIFGASKILRDITERKKAEEQIRTEKLFSESLINSLPGIFYLYDQDGRFARWNKNFETISGYTGEEISHMHPLDFYDADEKKLVKQKMEKAFSDGDEELTAHFYTKNKKKIPYYFHGHKILLHGNNYLIVVGIDVSERMRAEQELVAYTQEIKKLTAHLEQVREEERMRIAREIHDELGQQLTGLKMDASWLSKKIGSNEKLLHEKLASMILLMDHSVKTIRRISSDLRPGVLDDLGLIAALEWQSNEFEKRSEIKCEFKSDVEDVHINRPLATSIFRIYQEALTNVMRHAKATRIEASVKLTETDFAVIIKDNGQGFDASVAKEKQTLGLIGMRERALMTGGELHIQSEVDKGTTIILTIPLKIINSET